MTPHTFLRVEVNEVGENYNFEVKYRDRDSETNLATAKLQINGKDYQLVAGKLSLLKSEIGLIEELSIEYICTNSLGMKTILIKNPDSIPLRFIEELFHRKQDLVSSLFK